MTEIERKALALLQDCGFHGSYINRKWNEQYEALCRAIERIEELEATERDCIDYIDCNYAKPLMELQAEHEAFRREVSDAVEAVSDLPQWSLHPNLWRFIIAKPDPLVDAVDELWTQDRGKAKYMADQLHKYLAAHGLEIREARP